jgi:hypothetical protein
MSDGELTLVMLLLNEHISVFDDALLVCPLNVDYMTERAQAVALRNRIIDERRARTVVRRPVPTRRFIKPVRRVM